MECRHCEIDISNTRAIGECPVPDCPIARPQNTADELRASQARIATLEAERDKAREEAARWKASYTRAAEQCTQACEQRRAVEAENARLTHERDIARKSHQGACRLYLQEQERIAELRAENARLKAALQFILAPFPSTCGCPEDMLEDWISAVNRFRATARAALKPQEPDND